MTPVIRQMTAADIPATIAVRLSTRENAITLDEMRDHYGVTPDSIACDLRETAAGWVAEAAGRILGFAMGDGTVGEVTVVAVAPDHEAWGIGGALLARVETWLFARGHTRLWLLASPDPGVRASGFYARPGRRATGAGGDVVLALDRPA